MIRSDSEPKHTAHRERREQQVAGVTIVETRSGIQLPDWAAVRYAVQGLATGKLRGEESVWQPIIGDNYDSFSFIPHIEDPKQFPIESFVKKLQRRARFRTVVADYYDRKIDDPLYPGMKTAPDDFPSRTNISVRNLPRKEGLLLELSNSIGTSPVGLETVEEGIAKSMWADRGIASEDVSVTYQPEAGKFQYDFDAVVDRLSPVLHLGEHPFRERAGVIFHRGRSLGQRAADYFMSREIDAYSFRLGRVGDFALDISLPNDYVEKATAEQDGAILSGPTSKYRSGRKSIESQPVLKVSVHRSIDGIYHPAVTHSDKQTMRKIASEIKTAFSK